MEHRPTPFVVVRSVRYPSWVVYDLADYSDGYDDANPDVLLSVPATDDDAADVERTRKLWTSIDEVECAGFVVVATVSSKGRTTHLTLHDEAENELAVIGVRRGDLEAAVEELRAQAAVYASVSLTSAGPTCLA